MEYKINTLENVIKIDFTVSFEEFSVCLGKALEAICKEKEEEKIALSEYIEKNGADELSYRALNFAINDGFVKAVSENNITVLSQPRVSIGQVNVTGGSTTFSLEIDKAPDVILGKYKGLEIKINLPTPSVTVDEIEKKKAEIALANKEYETVDGKLENGHISVIDFVGSVDGVEFEGGKAENYELIIGSGMFIPGFEEQMVGMEKGEVRIIKVRFPDEYTPELAGKDAEFKVTLHEIKKEVKRDFDEKMLEKYASERKLTSVKTMDDFNKYLREEIYRQKERMVEEEIAKELEKALCDNSKAEIPDNMVEDEVNYQLHAYEHQAKQYGMELDMMISILGLSSVDDLKAQIRKSAKTNIMLQLIAGKIAEEEKLEATDEEIEFYFTRLASGRGMDVEQVKKEISKEQLGKKIASEKAIVLVRRTANITYA
jgi:trigger factor